LSYLLLPFIQSCRPCVSLSACFRAESGQQSAEEAGTMSPEEIIAEACKLPLPALERVAWILRFEVQGRMQECGGDQEELGRAWP
jgi:hypothetical protein